MQIDQRFSFDALPFFTHFSDADRSAFLAASKEIRFEPGDTLDLRAAQSLHIVVSGLFRSEGTLQRDESVLFGPGSMLGPLPFAEITPRGTVKALVPSGVRVIPLEDLYRVLIGSYRTARGYMRVLSRSLFESSRAAREMSSQRTRIVAVTGAKGSGKTLAAICLARSLSKQGRTILLDMTLSGRSSFDYLQMKLLPPLSQKKAGAISDSFLHERIGHTPGGFDIMNISAGSKVHVDPGINSPVLFYLSRFYSYVVIDCGSVDGETAQHAVSASDFVCAVSRNRRDLAAVRSFSDRCLSEGQGFFLCDNRYFAKKPAADSLMSLEKIPVDSEEGIIFELDEVLSGADGAVRRISAVRDLYLLSGAGFSSAHYAGLASVLPTDGSAVIAAGSLPLVSVLLQLSEGEKKGMHEVASFFREENIRAVTAPVFPDKWLLSNAPVRRSLDVIGHSLRLENTGIPVVAHMGRPGAQDFLASTGPVRELAAASFCEAPLFEPVKAGRSLLCAPAAASGIGRALTLSVDRITVCSVVRTDGYASVLPLVRGAFGDSTGRNPFLQQKWISDGNIVIDADPASQSFKKSIFSSREKWARAVEENKKD